MTSTSLTYFLAAAAADPHASMVDAGRSRRTSLRGNGQALAWGCVR